MKHVEKILDEYSFEQISKRADSGIVSYKWNEKREWYEVNYGWHESVGSLEEEKLRLEMIQQLTKNTL